MRVLSVLNKKLCVQAPMIYISMQMLEPWSLVVIKQIHHLYSNIIQIQSMNAQFPKAKTSCNKPASTNNEINSKKITRPKHVFRLSLGAGQHIVKLTTSPFASQILFQIYFACWLYLIPGNKPPFLGYPLTAIQQLQTAKNNFCNFLWSKLSC